jgi:NAD(P)-dependent dehydrogenase (short-subunit alcohol dehydrogenase family)
MPIWYNASKSALSQVSACFKFHYQKDPARIFTYCPGFTESNLGTVNKVANGAKPTVEGARPMVPILNGEKDAEHGGFLNSDGGQHPW